MSLLLDERPVGSLPQSVMPFAHARVQKNDAGGMSVEGFLVTYGEVNMNGWLWVPGAALEGLKERPSERKPLVMKSEHEMSIGRWMQAKDSEAGVFGSGAISDTTLGRDTATLLSDGAVTGISVGFRPEAVQFVTPGERVEFDTPYGKRAYTIEEYAIAVIKASIREASIVGVPADDEARVTNVQSVIAKAHRALPGLSSEPTREDLAYSMALLMGGRGAAAFTDLPDFEHRALYEQLAHGYKKHGLTPPPYERAPVYSEVSFRHDERAVFHDRYLRKSLDVVIAGAAGIEGALSPETREQAEAARVALHGLLERRTDADVLAEIDERLRATLTTVKGE
jgi:HK97 family phage prohead protease